MATDIPNLQKINHIVVVMLENRFPEAGNYPLPKEMGKNG